MKNVQEHHMYATLLRAGVEGRSLADDVDNLMDTRVSVWNWLAKQESHKAILGSV